MHINLEVLIQSYLEKTNEEVDFWNLISTDIKDNVISCQCEMFSLLVGKPFTKTIHITIK